MKTTKLQGSICTVCKIGKLAAGEATFNVKQGHQLMMIQHVPGFVCCACTCECFEESMSRDLIKMTEAMFAKSHCHTFIFQFSDFIRPDKDAQEYEIFDRVRIQEGVDTWDFYDEDLEPGMEGTVLGKGEKPFDYLVEFRLGSGMQSENFLQVDIDRDDLELVRRVGEQPAKRKRAKASC